MRLVFHTSVGEQALIAKDHDLQKSFSSAFCLRVPLVWEGLGVAQEGTVAGLVVSS